MSTILGRATARAFAFAIALAWSSAIARAQDADVVPAGIGGSYSPYEQATIDTALTRIGSTLDDAPQGKIVERIDIVTLDPIEARDPAPTSFNALHSATRPSVIRREVLIDEGQPWSQTLVDETARNLRQIPKQSLVLCVAARGSTDRTVRLLVITKDVWSLVVDADLAVTSGGLERLLLKPREANLAGTQQTVAARMILEPKTVSFGAGYVVPRVDGRRLALVIDGNVIVGRGSGVPEGSYGTVTATRPLFSTATRWGWVAGVAWRDELFRRYSEARVATFDAPSTPQDDRIPYVYRARWFSQQISVIRSFGISIKNDFTLGVELTRREFRMPDLVGVAPSAIADFRSQIPVGERRVGPYLQWHGYPRRFLRGLDLETLGLQEDVAIGYDLVLRVYPVMRALGSTRTFLGVFAAAQYTQPLGDGLARVSMQSTTEAEPERLSDATLTADVRVVTPRLGIGRLIFDGMLVDRYRNHLNVQSFLGGEGRLRGFPTRALVGRDVVAINLEYRTRPIELASIQVGAALFYDAGDAFDGFSQFRPKHAIGLGTRMVLPQIDRGVLRCDVGFPMPFAARPSGVSAVTVFIAFEHAFGLHGVGPNDATTTPAIGGMLGE